VVENVPLDWEPNGIAITPDGSYVYVIADEEHCVYVIAEP
jgi:DNA-binding beta-propeller fold protein YncE